MMKKSDQQEVPPDPQGGDDHERGLELIRRGIGYGQVQQLEKGILCLLEGLLLIDERHDPRLHLSAHHNLALFFAHCGLPRVARGIVARVQGLYREVDDPVVSGRLLWLLGTISRYSNDFRRAEGRMRQAMAHFRELGLEDQASAVEEELAEMAEERKKVEAGRTRSFEERDESQAQDGARSGRN